MIYANYIRNKMRHLLKTVFASGYPLKIISKFKKQAVDYTIHGKTEIGKNLLPYPFFYTTQTINGVTFTDNGDGTVTVNGTATADTIYFLAYIGKYVIRAGTYTLTGCPKGGSATTYCQILGSSDYRDFGNGITRTYPTDSAQNVFIKIYSGYTADNLVFKPMLELGDTATEYEPYTEYGVGDAVTGHDPYNYKIPLVNSGTTDTADELYRAPSTTNVYCVAQLKDGESISYRADGLPELQLYKGENNITADTTINPTTIDVKYLN